MGAAPRRIIEFRLTRGRVAVPFVRMIVYDDRIIIEWLEAGERYELRGHDVLRVYEELCDAVRASAPPGTRASVYFMDGEGRTIGRTILLPPGVVRRRRRSLLFYLGVSDSF